MGIGNHPVALLTPETTSTKSGSLSPSSTRFHRQERLRFGVARLMEGDVVLASIDRTAWIGTRVTPLGCST